MQTPPAPGTPQPLPTNPTPTTGGTNNRIINPQADLVQKFISENKVMITNAQLPSILPRLQNRGYTTTVLQQKATDLDNLQRLNEAQRREYGEQYQSTANYNAAEDALHEDYTDHLGYARLAFKGNKAAQTALGLKGKRHRSQAGYAAQGLLFYNNLLTNATWKTAIAAKGVTNAELTTQQAAFTNLAALEAAQAKETGEAQGATAARDAAYEALKAWVKEMRATAKIALRKFPELSEQLGIKDPS